MTPSRGPGGRTALALGWALQATVAIASAVAILATLAWVVAGRLEATWPIRNLVRASIDVSLGAVWRDPDGQAAVLPGSLAGRITTRIVETPAAGDVAATSPDTVADPQVTPTPTARDVGVPEATVMVVDAQANAVEAHADATGDYAVHGLNPGRYRVIASAPGFAPTVIDHPPDASPLERLVAWVAPGVVVRENAPTALAISLDRPSASPLAAFARDVRLPDGDPEWVSCATAAGTPVVVGRLPVTVASPGVPISSLRRYVSLDPLATAPLPAPSPNGAGEGGTFNRARAVAVVPVGSEEDGCAAMRLAAAGVEVVVVGVTPEPGLERHVRAVRAILAAMRVRPADGAGATTGMAGSGHATEGDADASRHGPVVIGAGFASIIATRAVADEAATVPVPPVGGGSEAERLEARRRAVAARVAGVVLVAPVLDTIGLHRELGNLSLPTYLAEAVRSLGPADLEARRHVRWSARHAIDAALPPVVISRGGPRYAPLDWTIDQWARLAGTVGVAVEVTAPGTTDPWDDEAATAHVVARTAALARGPGQPT